MSDKSSIKLTIGIPTAGLVKTKTMVSIVKAARDLPFRVNIIAWEGCLIHQNRENIAREFLNSDATHLLFIDSDILFQTQDIITLLERNKDIIGAHYNMKVQPPISTVKVHDKNGVDISKKTLDGLLEVYAVATGFMLIKRKVFETLPHPWFSYRQDDQGNTVVGEDIWLCEKAREKGFKIYCDPSIKIKHIGDFLY